MNLYADRCTCDAVLLPTILRRCPVHGSRETRDRLERAEEQVRLLRDCGEAAVGALLDILPLNGSWETGYQLEESVHSRVVALPEEWASAAQAVMELHRAVRGEAVGPGVRSPRGASRSRSRG